MVTKCPQTKDGQTDTGAWTVTLILLLFPNAKCLFKGLFISQSAVSSPESIECWITANKTSLVSLVCQLVSQLDTEDLSDPFPHKSLLCGCLITIS